MKKRIGKVLSLSGILTLAAGIAVATPASAAAGDVTAEQAAQAAVDQYDGCTINVEADDYDPGDGNKVDAWEVELKNTNVKNDANGRIEVKVSMTGEVLAKEDEDSDDGECDPALPAADTNDQPFPDVDSSNLHYKNIVWLKDQNITKSKDGKFHPLNAVNRGSMTAFLFRLTHPDTPQPKCTDSGFTDVGASDEFCGYIQWAKKNGIAHGYSDGHYGASNAVTRGAMSAYLFRVANPGQAAGECTEQPFEDIAVDDPLCGAITWMADNNITFGVGDGTNYGTAKTVDRQQMASFLHRVA